jgi:hypothetical protein
VCDPLPGQGCIVTVAHTLVSGAVAYVVEHPLIGQVPCSDASRVCIVRFPRDVPAGCAATVRAIDVHGVAGTPSAPFCIFGD